MTTLMHEAGLVDEALPQPHAGARARVSAFPFVMARAEHDDPVVAAAWQRLLAASPSPEALYQTPDFFRCLQDQDEGELFVIRRQADDAICGVIPARRIGQRLEFRLGAFVLFKRDLSVFQVLGSIPLLDPNVAGLREFAIGALLQRSRGCPALFLQAVPRELAGRVGLGERLSGYALHGWRDCHTMPLPDDFASYLNRFGAKKRYNLARQVRLLSEQAGDAHAVRIETPAQVGQLMTALATLMAPDKFAEQAKYGMFAQLARQGLLHAYVIRCGARDVAVVLGTRSDKVWHVHHICFDTEYRHLSLGTSAMHLALADVIDGFAFSHVDFGYGTPRYDFRATHVPQSRAQLLVYRRGSLTGLLFRAHAWHDRLNESLIGLAKRIRAAFRL